MAEAKEPLSFGRLVFGKAVSDTIGFLRYTTRDLILGAVTLALGAGLAYVFVGKADTMKELVFVAAFTFAPAGIVLISVFVWHLWLAPAALAYEAFQKTIPEPRPNIASRLPGPKPSTNWAAWKARATYTLAEFGAILAREDPGLEIETPGRESFTRLLAEAARTGQLVIRTGPYYDTGDSPDIYPNHFIIEKQPALTWAKGKGFDVSHVE